MCNFALTRTQKDAQTVAVMGQVRVSSFGGSIV